MRKIPVLILAAAATMALGACAHHSRFAHSRPDEFAVQRQAPLIIPPDFSLSPPQPGAPRPTSRGGNQDTLDALFGGPATRSAVEKNTISRAGAADPSIRSTVGDAQTNTVAKGSVTRDILAAPQGDGREAQAAAGS